MIELLNIDCMEYMKTVKDNEFDLAIVDPPYGIDAGNTFGGEIRKSGKGEAKKTAFKVKDWDKNAPDSDYFNELLRVSKQQIIWGANYYPQHLKPSMGWVFWDKNNGTTKFSDGEIAYTSFNSALRIFRYTWNGMIQGDMKNKEARIHPTQKPVKLYQWLLDKYAKKGQRILDTHLGSGSSAIAAHYFGVEFVGCELDKDYFNAAKNRFELATAQKDMFSGGGMNTVWIKALSVNQAFQGRRFKTPQYKKFEYDVLRILPALKIPEGFLYLSIEFGYSSKLSDFDNGLKPFIDCLQKKYGFNDNKIKKAFIEINNDVAKGEEYIKFSLQPVRKEAA